MGMSKLEQRSKYLYYSKMYVNPCLSSIQIGSFLSFDGINKYKHIRIVVQTLICFYWKVV